MLEFFFGGMASFPPWPRLCSPPSHMKTGRWIFRSNPFRFQKGSWQIGRSLWSFKTFAC